MLHDVELTTFCASDIMVGAIWGCRVPCTTSSKLLRRHTYNNEKQCAMQVSIHCSLLYSAYFESTVHILFAHYLLYCI